MKRKIIIYGEFIEESTTGIAYVNSNLFQVFQNLKFKVTKLKEPRSLDYQKNKSKIKKRLNIKSFIYLFFDLLNLDNHDISFITLSMGNIGLLKTLLIHYLLQKKSKRVYLYIHRGDLDKRYLKSIFRKFIISNLFKNSFKIIFLSKIFILKLEKELLKDKYLVIPNSLNEEDCKISTSLFNNKIKNVLNKQKYLKIIYASNLQKQKGIHKIIKSVNLLNKNLKEYKIKLDIYGLQFEEIKGENNLVQYKGLLKTKKRLSTMSKYDFLITASNSEGLPITLIECLAIGLPFITTKVGAIDDLLISNYPYICSYETKSITNTLKKARNDNLNENNKIKDLIIANNKLFKTKFSSKKFFFNVKKSIF